MMFYEVVPEDHLELPPVRLPNPYAPKKSALLVTAILTGLVRGLTRRAAYGRVGIPHETFRRWLMDPDFAAQVEQAEDRAEAEVTEIIMDAARTDWKAGMEWLRRRRPRDWSDGAASQDVETLVRAMGEAQGLTEQEIREATKDAVRMLREDRSMPRSNSLRAVE